ncbi:transposase, partial [Bacteroides fragilis]
MSMYSYEERMKAVQLYIKYEHSLASVIQELGYPSPKALYKWFKEYEKEGDLSKTSKRNHQFTHEEKQFAVDHYIEFGRNYYRTVRMLGYPDRNLLSDWCKELAPETRKIRRSKLNYSQEQKKEAVIHLVSRKTSVRKIAERLQVTRKTLYDWKQELIGEELPPNMSKIPNNQNTEELKDEVDTLKRQVYQLRIEKDILEKSAELIKKDIGINPKDLSNKKKARVIDALSETYPLKALLKSLNVAKSSYFYHRSQLKQSDKYSGLRVLVKEIFTENQAIYGYRRIHSELKNRKIIVSEKVVRRLMKEEKLTVRFVAKKKYNSYAGEIVPAL